MRFSDKFIKFESFASLMDVVQNERKSIEEQIIVEADVMSNFDNIAGIFQAALVYEHQARDEAKDSVREKLKRKWSQLHFESSKKIIKPKFEAAMLLFK